MKKPITISFIKPPNHINEFLTHWTGRKDKEPKEAFNILCKIIKTKALKLSKCSLGFTNENENKKYSVPMICFTETSIEQSLEHCQTYGYFGISFNKKEMIQIGANPVLYIVDSRKEYYNDFNNYHDKNRSTNVPIEIRNNLSWVLSTIQPYKDKDNMGICKEYHFEREWRIIRVLPFHKESELIKDGFDIKELTFDWEELDADGLPICYLHFKNSFIENIIVHKGFEECAKQLLKENGLEDCQIFIVEDEKKIKKITI